MGTIAAWQYENLGGIQMQVMDPDAVSALVGGATDQLQGKICLVVQVRAPRS